MSDYGAEFYDANGKMYLGGGYWAYPIVDVIEGYYFPTGSQTYSVSYPELAGFELETRIAPRKHFYTILSDSAYQTITTINASFDYSAGYPVATYTRSDTNYPSVVLEVSVKSVTTNNYGCHLFNSNGDLFSGTAAGSYQFLGKFAVPRQYALLQNVVDGYPATESKFNIEYQVHGGAAMWTHEITLPASMFASQARPMIFVDVPDSPAGVREHALLPTYNQGQATGGWVVRLTTIGGFDPTIYVFVSKSLQAAPASAGYGMEVYNSSGQMLMSTNQKMLATLPRQTLVLSTPQNGTGDFSTKEIYTLPAILGGGRPLIPAATPRSMISANKHSKNWADLDGYWSKFWSKNSAGNLECAWVNIFYVAGPSSNPYEAMIDYPGGYSFTASNSIFYD